MKKNKSFLILIFTTIFLDLLGFGIIIPILPFYAEHYGASAFDIGLLGTVFSLMQFIFAPIWGRISDRVGRRPIIVISLVGKAVAFLMFGLADSLFWLFAARIFAGITSATVPTAMAYISDVTSEKDRAKGMGMVGAAFGLGFIFGPAIGGGLSIYGYNVPIYFAAGISLIAAVIAYWKLPESLTLDKRRYIKAVQFNFDNLINAVSRPNLGLLFLIFFSVTLSFANLETVFALFTERKFGYNAADNGYIFAYIGIISVTVQGGLIGPLVNKFGEKKLITFSTFLLSITFFLITVPENIYAFLAIVGLIAIGIGIHNPSVVTLISKNTPAEEQGGIFGINQSFSSLARVLGPMWAGFIFDAAGIGYPFVSGGIMIFFVFLLTFRLYSKNLTQSINQEI